VIKNDAARLGDHGFYGFAFQLDKNWEFDDTWITISQFITSFKDWGCPYKKEWTPSTMIWIRNHQIYTRVRYGDVCHNDDEKVFKVGKVMAGTWHTIVIGAVWRSRQTNDGFFQAWFDGKLIVNEHNIPTMCDIDSRFYQFRVGIYPDWFDPMDPNNKRGIRRIKEVTNFTFLAD